MDETELEEKIAEQVGEWSSNSNECFTIELVSGDGTVTSFNPEFTYPIFGEEEAIFGYQDLEINLSFAAHNLKSHLSISYGTKFPAQGEVKPTDIYEALRDFLPPKAFSNEDATQAVKDESAAQFRPPGERIHRYARGGQSYEIWCANMSDPAARELLQNMEILMPMFIEGGSMLQLEQDWTTQRWKLFLLYNITPKPEAGPAYSPFSLVGYGTSYRIFTFPDRTDSVESDLNIFAPSSQSIDDFLPPPDSTVENDLAPTAHPDNICSPLDLPSRERLSQFLILPPFQKEGHGQELYNAMYRALSNPSNVCEFTVEDPNEAFDDLRDLCDLLHLRAHDEEFAALRINTNLPADKLMSETELPTDIIVPVATRNAIMKRTKLMQRQFDRLVEMHTLSAIPPLHRNRSRVTRREKASNPHDKAYYIWRLYAKQRLFLFNRDQLAQLERSERIEKLESALDAVQTAYAEMIEKVEEREKKTARAIANGNGSPGVAKGGAEVEETQETPRKKERKRKVVEDDEDEDEEEGTAKVVTNGHKKARVDLT
ncbi:histone acetyltransferase 1 [Saxophila tyrrhenica]|uniref:Histone acetyltransferase type B catalytic subunit n=1 Tax=Saxophila tyrrhenica TaxID=1690608 RepID=A0AAV9PMQ8_9PEZI|nr:histone acetyltransferase 1 [Saxophila tyrrhenica]